MSARVRSGCVVFLVAAFLAVALAADSATAAITGLRRVASGVNAPIFVTHAPGDRSRLFIAERGGVIRILNLHTGSMLPTPFLTMSGISTDGEGGFLGLAFHPDYSNSGMPGFGKFYVNVTTNSTTQTHIREFTVSTGDPNVANAGSLRQITSFAQPQDNHNGGWIGFSPNNKFLYIASGDGGGGNDTGTGHTAGTGNAQDVTNNPLGKMLRIDPTGDDFPTDSARNYAIPPTNPFKTGVGTPTDDGGDDEIWAFGLRNPFRASFDRSNGDLWIGDVGQGAREEINRQPAASAGGENYGWRLREGTIATPTVGGECTGTTVCTEPVYDYDRDQDQMGGSVVTGGYVYRGPDPSLQGKYFFLDSRNDSATANDNYWMFDPANPRASVMNIDSLLVPNVGSLQFPVSFGEDAVGNLYIAYIASGEVHRIATAAIAGDYDFDGNVDNDDYHIWKATLGTVATVGTGVLSADGNGNNTVDAADYVLWRNNFGASLASGGSNAVPEPAPAAIIGALLALFPPFWRHRLPELVHVSRPCRTSANVHDTGARLRYS
jgi:glucose/arabinose dehydrogenase